ncbi:uncharacterized protein ColSpa_04792 [Colletotrichum spaethianum]|uniref:Uncharacterized protein n=1 Tax=Colletotrichum spaethianum TaxID=700344 RepID=A0AA37LA32_9PEZI|nr:uncharacterized protein ColSpa_04792 [Colletotrichum spaethianum]GKT44611.1 hypothetical protein ColSpa_04792 [Colletotrichum spaethianum]
MDQLAAQADLPPEYVEDVANVHESLPPDTLRLAGRFIHSATSRDADAPGLYEINSQIDFLRETDRLVEFSRIDYSVRRRIANAVSLPEIISHPRHVFNLERPTAIVQEAFLYYIKPVSRSGLGSIGLKFSKIGKSVCKAWRVGRKASNRNEYEARELLFDVRHNNDVLDWLDGQNTRIAVEYSKDNMHSLNILVPMDQAVRDALVAAWCVRLWNTLAVQFHKRRTWKDAGLPK